MIKATLYVPQQPPREISADELGLQSEMLDLQRIPIPRQVSVLLECAPGLVDVLDDGLNYVAYSVFDHEGHINTAAMDAVGALSPGVYDIEDEDALLRGPILLIKIETETKR
jgi:hypothetical protein